MSKHVGLANPILLIWISTAHGNRAIISRTETVPVDVVFLDDQKKKTPLSDATGQWAPPTTALN